MCWATYILLAGSPEENKFWFRKISYDTNSVLYDAYLCNLELLAENKKCWLYNVREIPFGLINCGLGQVQPQKVVNNLKCLYEFQWLNHINRNDDHNKLRTYNKF